jgi:uncharacterized membrane protein
MSLSPLGVFHTIIGIGAVLAVICLLWQDKHIDLARPLAKLYLLATVLTAGSALGIFRHGGANPAHGLAVLTILAVVFGVIAAKTNMLGGFQRYFVALCFSSTVLFHLIPTATEILTRFPAGEPLVSSLKDPLLLKTYLVILVVFVIGFALQLKWLHQQPAGSKQA